MMESELLLKLMSMLLTLPTGMKLMSMLLMLLTRKGPSFRGSFVLAPGVGLGAFLRALLGKRVYERVLEQHIADHAEEWVEAEATGKRGLSLWIRVRCWIVLIWTVFALLPLEKVYGLLKGEVSEKKKKGAGDD